MAVVVITCIYTVPFKIPKVLVGLRALFLMWFVVVFYLFHS